MTYDKPTTKAVDERFHRLRSEFLADYRAQKEWREECEEWGRYYDGEQWTDEEKDIFKQRGQPTTVFNRIKPKLDAIFGIQLALSVDTKAYPKTQKEMEATVISEELRNVEDASDFDSEESLAFEDMAIDGVGWYECTKEFDGLTGIDKVQCVSNKSVVLDRFTTWEDRRRGDLKTAKQVHKTTWADLEDAKSMFPGNDEELEEAVNAPKTFAGLITDSKSSEYRPDQYAQEGGSNSGDMLDMNEFVDVKRKRLRFVTSYYRVPTRRKFLRSSGETLDVTGLSESDLKKANEALGEGVTEWSELVYELHSVTYTWCGILEEKRNIRPYDRIAKFPLILIPGYVTRCEKRAFYGLVKQMIGAQDEVNKRRAKMLHLLTTRRVRFHSGAFDNEAEARREFARPDAWIKQTPGAEVMVEENLEVAQSHFMMLTEAKNEIDTSGVNKEIEGRSSASSGREFQLRQQQAMQSIRKLFANLRAARRRVAMYILDEILYRRPDLQITQYDILIEEAPDSISLQSETFDSLMKIADTMLKSGQPAPLDLLIEASPLEPETKQKILEKMQQAQAAQAAQMQAMMAAQQQGQGAPQ